MWDMLSSLETIDSRIMHTKGKLTETHLTCITPSHHSHLLEFKRVHWYCHYLAFLCFFPIMLQRPRICAFKNIVLLAFILKTNLQFYCLSFPIWNTRLWLSSKRDVLIDTNIMKRTVLIHQYLFSNRIGTHIIITEYKKKWLGEQRDKQGLTNALLNFICSLPYGWNSVP